MENDLDAFGERIWASLHPDNKVSLFVRSIELTGGKTETRVYNKNQK